MNEAKPIKLWFVGTILVKHVVVRLGNNDDPINDELNIKVVNYLCNTDQKQHFFSLTI